MESQALPYDSSDLLSKALDATFVGKQFWFGFSKGVGSSQSSRQVAAPCLATLTRKLDLADGTSKPDSTMVASQMVRAGDGPFCTVMGNFNSLLETGDMVQNPNVTSEQEFSSMSFHDGKQDFRLSNTSVFFKDTGNRSESSCMSSNPCYNSCLLSCEREQSPGKRLSKAYASYNSYAPDHSLFESHCVQGLRNPSNKTGNALLVRKSLNGTEAPMRSCKIVDWEKSDEVPSKVTAHVLPLDMCQGETLLPCDDQDVTLPPCGDENRIVFPCVDHDQTLPPSDDGNISLTPFDDCDDTFPPSDDVTVATVDGHYKKSPQCGGKDHAQSRLHSSEHSVLDIEALRNRSTSATPENRSATFDDSSFLLECNRMETTAHNYSLLSQRENKVSQQRKGYDKIYTSQEYSITVNKALVTLSPTNLSLEHLELTACASLPQGGMDKDSKTGTKSLKDICTSSAFRTEAHFNNDQICSNGNDPMNNYVSNCVEELPKDLKQIPIFEDGLWEDWSSDEEVDSVTKRCHPCEIDQKTEGTLGKCKSKESVYAGRGAQEDTPAKEWEELPESEDLAAFLGDYSTSRNSDKGGSETHSDKSGDVPDNLQPNSDEDLASYNISSDIQDLNRSCDLIDKGLPVTTTKCLSHDSAVFCPSEDIKSNDDNQQCWESKFSEFISMSTERKHLSKISDAVCESHVLRTDPQNSPRQKFHNLSTEECSFDLFDSFQSLPPVVDCVVKAEGKESSQHIILESQISSPKNRSPIKSPDALQEHRKSIAKSVKFSRRLSAVSNVRLMDIRMKVAPNPASRERRTPRSCLKRQSVLSVNKENVDPTGCILKALDDDSAELPRQRHSVLPESEELFTPSPITVREAQQSLRRQVLTCRSVKSAQSGTSGFTQSTPLLFSQCHGSLQKSITTYYLQGQQLSNVDLSVDLFASPDLFSQTELQHARSGATTPLWSADHRASQVHHDKVLGEKIVIGGHDVIKTYPNNSNDDDALSWTACVSSNISTCSSDLFSPDILGSSLPSQEWKEPLRKNLFF